MSDHPQAESCTVPWTASKAESEIIARLLRLKRIVVVGLSDHPSRASHRVASYLRSVGFDIVPVNPNHHEVLGVKCYASLAEVPGQIELVNVFRRSEFCGQVAREAAAARAKGLWLQSGIVSADARGVAASGGMDYVENRCIMVEHLAHRT